MKTSKITNRVHTGEAVLTAAKLTDTSAVAKELKAFAEIHKAYAKAQAKVEETVARAQEILKRATELDVLQDNALERLALRLRLDGKAKGRANPFGDYTNENLSSLQRAAVGSEAAQLLDLVAAVRKDGAVSDATVAAAAEVEAAAKEVIAVLEPMPSLEVALREARHLRDHTGDRWAKALSDLKFEARAAERHGVAGIYAALFGRSTRRSTKKAKGTSVSVPETSAVAA